LERDFRYLREKYGDAGARDIFEKICTELIQAKFDCDAHNIRVSQGDEGIDILVGDFNKPIENYQCKYFLDGIESAQITQIKHSFQRAVEAPDYKMRKWILCLPITLSAKEFKWWSEWSGQQEKLFEIDISLFDGGFLISQLKKYEIYEKAFDDDIRLKLDAILSYLENEKVRVCNEIIVLIDEADKDIYEDMLFVKKLESAKIELVEGCKRDFFNAEFAEYTIKSKDSSQLSELLNKLKLKVFNLWETQFRRYQDETNGNDLLTRTYERIESFDTTTLDCPPLPEVSLFAKKGMLHQWAEECSIGWLRNYKQKLDEYLGHAGK